jgi:hypothetical protein
MRVLRRSDEQSRRPTQSGAALNPRTRAARPAAGPSEPRAARAACAGVIDTHKLQHLEVEVAKGGCGRGREGGCQGIGGEGREFELGQGKAWLGRNQWRGLRCARSGMVRGVFQLSLVSRL